MSLYEFGVSLRNNDWFNLREAYVNHDSIYIFGGETINRLIYIWSLIGEKLDRQISYRWVKVRDETPISSLATKSDHIIPILSIYRSSLLTQSNWPHKIESTMLNLSYSALKIQPIKIQPNKLNTPTLTNQTSPVKFNMSNLTNYIGTHYNVLPFSR